MELEVFSQNVVEESSSMLDKPKLITIEYARKKLGERGEKMTDKQIDNILVMLRLICSKTINSVVSE
jgi:hypothetical protein